MDRRGFLKAIAGTVGAAVLAPLVKFMEPQWRHVSTTVGSVPRKVTVFVDGEQVHSYLEWADSDVFGVPLNRIADHLVDNSFQHVAVTCEPCPENSWLGEPREPVEYEESLALDGSTVGPDGGTVSFWHRSGKITSEDMFKAFDEAREREAEGQKLPEGWMV